jgi:murein DD-endopeptidase MepM/ murein hydrolase activator NlpD
MVESDDSYFQGLIDQLKGLPGFKNQQPASATPTPGGQRSQFVGSPGRFTAPIHGAWHNLGGFAPSMKRYDDDPKAAKGRGHFGVDMSAAAGTPVYALTSGTVNTVGTDPMGGNIVGIQHANGLWSYYAHLSTASVQKGDKVDSNTVIGTVGNTGNAGNPNDPLKTQEGGRTWPHCHFGIKENGSWVDPAKYITIPAYDPSFAKNPSKYQKFWVSEQAKQEAEAFNMKDHISKRRTAFSNHVDGLMKLAFEYARATKKI